MPNRVKLKIANLNIDVQFENPKISDLCRDYTVSGETGSDIEVLYNKEMCEREAALSGHPGAPAEFASIYRQIAEALPFYRRAVVHGAVVSYCGKAYMFIAKSGTGKTTHINLWRKYFSGVDIINGDKPVLAANDKEIIAYGTPWAGKEMWQKNTSAPLCGICLIKRGNKNSIKKLENDDRFSAVFNQVYMPENEDSLNLTMKIIDDIIRLVPVYELTCDISKEAAECSFNTLTKA